MSEANENRDPDARRASFCYAIVTMFGMRKTCKVTAYGIPQAEYAKSQMLWIERGEDEYAIPGMTPPFCVLQREDWLRGIEA